MEAILGIPWYYFPIVGGLTGIVIGRIFKGLDFEKYFSYSLVVVVVAILLGAVGLFATLAINSVPGRIYGDVFFALLGDVVALWVTNLITTFLFRN